MFLYLIRLHVPLVVARSPFIRSPVHKIILFVPTFLCSALLLALNMARLTVQQFVNLVATAELGVEAMSDHRELEIIRMHSILVNRDNS